MYPIMQLFEPQWWVDLLQSMNTWISVSTTRFHVASFVADFIVFLFPLFLLILYITWIYKRNNINKIYALRIFSSATIAAIINILFQFIFNKNRPETALEGTQRLILKHLPTMSFPSDHAAVSMAFAIWILLWVWMIKNKRCYKMITYTGIFFVIASIAMSIARVAVGIHWPTDIIAWWIVGIIAAYCAYYLLPEKILQFLIKIEEGILYIIGIYKK